MMSQPALCKIISLNDDGIRWDVKTWLTAIFLDFGVLSYEKLKIFVSYALNDSTEVMIMI